MYRDRVLAVMPWLRELDFSSVTKTEALHAREDAAAAAAPPAVARGTSQYGMFGSSTATMLGWVGGSRRQSVSRNTFRSNKA